MTSDDIGEVEIITDENGKFKDIRLRRSSLSLLIQTHQGFWTEPLLLCGPDVSADLRSLLRRKQTEREWYSIEFAKDILGKLPDTSRLANLSTNFDKRIWEHKPPHLRRHLEAIIVGEAPLEGIIPLLLRENAGDLDSNESTTNRIFTAFIENICARQGIIIPWIMKDSLFPLYFLAMWRQRPRKFPLIVHNEIEFSVPNTKGLLVPTSRIRFEALISEVDRVYGLKRTEVEKAYRVWQLSRTGADSKEQATTPKSLSLEIASNFLVVLTRARTTSEISLLARQKAAPAMFQLESGAVGLKHGVVKQDSDAVTIASAASLRRRVDRLRSDIGISNLIPSSNDVLIVVLGLLDRIGQNNFGDGEIVELGLELNAYQWHVDAVKKHLSETSLGELTGLFATAHLFLCRFATWLEYTGSAAPVGSQEDGVAAFKLARNLLKDARDKPFLTEEAGNRIATVLDRVPSESSPPALREGLVRSGENLAAITADGVSRVIARESHNLTSKIKDHAYEEASKSIVSFSTKNAAILFKMAELRGWPWMNWLQHLFSQIA